jgi:hypothetical protein
MHPQMWSTLVVNADFTIWPASFSQVALGGLEP